MQTTPDSTDDHSTSFGQMRTRLASTDGRRYREVRAELTPRWWLVWVDIAFTWVVIAIAAAAMLALRGESVTAQLLVASPAAVLIGTMIHRLGLFVHEGAHANVAPGRWNDPVTNLLAGAVTLTEVGAYRPVHMAHHRLLGSRTDTERTYFQRFDARFLLRAASGANVLSVVRQRSNERIEHTTAAGLAVPLTGAAAHAAVVIGSVLTDSWGLAVAWAVGTCSIYPLVQSTRQLLEHRRQDAEGSVDYTAVDHGSQTRMFDTAMTAQLFGAAGFHRHLLHHWDAKISYTRLNEMQRWLMTTDARELIVARRCTYVQALRELWNR